MRQRHDRDVGHLSVKLIEHDFKFGGQEPCRTSRTAPRDHSRSVGLQVDCTRVEFLKRSAAVKLRHWQLSALNLFFGRSDLSKGKVRGLCWAALEEDLNATCFEREASYSDFFFASTFTLWVPYNMIAPEERTL